MSNKVPFGKSSVLLVVQERVIFIVAAPFEGNINRGRFGFPPMYYPVIIFCNRYQSDFSSSAINGLHPWLP